MTRGIVHRLRRLEERSAAAGASHIHSQLIRFIAPGGQVASTLLLETGKPNVWTHLLREEPSSAARAQSELASDISS
jgi:hypothetical protein